MEVARACRAEGEEKMRARCVVCHASDIACVPDPTYVYATLNRYTSQNSLLLPVVDVSCRRNGKSVSLPAKSR